MKEHITAKRIMLETYFIPFDPRNLGLIDISVFQETLKELDLSRTLDEGEEDKALDLGWTPMDAFFYKTDKQLWIQARTTRIDLNSYTLKKKHRQYNKKYITLSFHNKEFSKDITFLIQVNVFVFSFIKNHLT